MRDFFLVGSCFPVELLFPFFNELPPVKVNVVEKPAAFERLPVPGAPLYGACHAERQTYKLQKNSTCGSADAWKMEWIWVQVQF